MNKENELRKEIRAEVCNVFEKFGEFQDRIVKMQNESDDVEEMARLRRLFYKTMDFDSEAHKLFDLAYDDEKYYR